MSRDSRLQPRLPCPSGPAASSCRPAPPPPWRRWLPRLAPSAPATGPRERLLLDFGWRFHLGHANDLTQDFGFGHGGNQDSEFGKSGELFGPSRGNFDDSGWRAVDLPHDWAVELPYVQAEELNDFGDHPLGRNYPATSIGWYRRVFTLPAARRRAADLAGVRRHLPRRDHRAQRPSRRPQLQRLCAVPGRHHRSS